MVERLHIGIQGLGIAEVSYQNAVSYARERLQGRSLTGVKAPDKPADPLAGLLKQDLDPLSIEELNERIAILKAEIGRVEVHIERVNRDRSAAEELFKR